MSKYREGDMVRILASDDPEFEVGSVHRVEMMGFNTVALVNYSRPRTLVLFWDYEVEDADAKRQREFAQEMQRKQKESEFWQRFSR